MRLQLLRAGIGSIRAIAYTHAHADHLFGLDDARLFPREIGGPVPVYCEELVEGAIRRAYSYAFVPEAERISPGGIPKLRFERIEPGMPFEILGESILPLRLLHGRLPVLGFRVRDMAYCTDVSEIPEETWPLLDGLEVLVLDALREEPHPTHFSLSEALDVVERLKPRRTYLTHLSHGFDHEVTNRALPRGVELAYDGLTLMF
jgi:phosphoribosyl 1,2-cyclic phosphate phosphodiesterase